MNKTLSGILNVRFSLVILHAVATSWLILPLKLNYFPLDICMIECNVGYNLICISWEINLERIILIIELSVSLRNGYITVTRI